MGVGVAGGAVGRGRQVMAAELQGASVLSRAPARAPALVSAASPERVLVGRMVSRSSSPPTLADNRRRSTALAAADALRQARLPGTLHHCGMDLGRIPVQQVVAGERTGF